jgi:hypothetical protein
MKYGHPQFVTNRFSYFSDLQSFCTPAQEQLASAMWVFSDCMFLAATQRFDNQDGENASVLSQ